MVDESSEPIERWTAKRRAALIMNILKGETSIAEAARKHALTVAEIEDWRDRFLAGAEHALRSRPKDDEALKDEQIKKLKQKIGELVLDNDILREALKPSPLERKTSDGSGPHGRMSRYAVRVGFCRSAARRCSVGHRYRERAVAESRCGSRNCRR